MCLVNCNLCGEKTSDKNLFDKDKKNKEVYVCECCSGKFGKKTKERLENKGIQFKKEKKEVIKPFTASINYSGGTKEDIANMVCNIMDSEEIWDEVKTQMGWF